MSSPSPGGPLTPAQLDAFHRDGYLLVPGALSPSLVASLLAETKRLLSTLDLTTHPLTQFHAGDSNHVGDAYFLASATNISFFLEPSAFDPATNTLLHPEGDPRTTAVNKIGHYLHALSPPFASLLPPDTPGNAVDVAGVARQLGFRDPRVLQSMAILKQPGVGGAVPPHQDSTFLYTDPPSAVGFWYALEDATRENGCLSFAAGSHRWKGVERRLVRKEGGGTEMVANEAGARFPRGEEGGEEEGGEGEYTMAETEAGTLVLIHGNLLHKSERNTSRKGRIAYTFHLIEGEEEYDGRNWLQPPAEGFTRVFKD